MIDMICQQQQLLMAWDKQFPATDWERERDRRIAARMGHNNPFVTGTQTWTLDHKNSKDGIYSVEQRAEVGVIRGNRNSKVYHLPRGCPSYDDMSPHNIVEFNTEGRAITSGYRKAGNCR